MTQRDSNSDLDELETGTNWFIGIIVALALLCIGYLVFSANDCGGAVCVTTAEATE